ncbi:MAG: hypothetical protein FJX62_05945 [Alphaproteobacteria bacterium]|nr:hypothetical protein [Alphaproteobacteria bacterium]
MSRLPAILNAIMRKVDAPHSDAGAAFRDHPAAPPLLGDAQNGVVRKLVTPEPALRETVFNLVPPGDGMATPQPMAEAAIEKPADEPAPAASERNVRPVGTMDLTRLSIDNDGRLYWDGKPVEVRRRIAMSRRQIVGAAIIGVFVVIGAIGAAIQGTAAARDWACRLGWIESTCATPAPLPQRARFDIPA